MAITKEVEEMEAVEEGKELVSNLCSGFYALGWVSGTGGSISIKITPDRIVMAPSGVQKERMEPKDIYVLDAEGAIVKTPETRPPPYRPPKLSECQPLFMEAYKQRNAGAVIHSHALSALMATLLHPGATEFRVTEIEMIKGIKGHGFYDVCVVPIIENTAYESELTSSLAAAMQEYPHTQAILVREHGVYIWGDDWISAKTQAECYHYLFEAAVKMKEIGLDARFPRGGGRKGEEVAPANGTKRLSGGEGAPAKKRIKKEDKDNSLGYEAVVIDIEGTTTPVTFVTEVLFPYARNEMMNYLTAHWEEDWVLQFTKDLFEELKARPIKGSSKEAELLTSAMKDMEWNPRACKYCLDQMMDEDRKVGVLKTLQGKIWQRGYDGGDLQGEVYEDVPTAFMEWHRRGIKIYIYSSGSRQAQHLLFANTAWGDLSKYISGYFDTKVGNKKEVGSYRDILLSIGSVDDPNKVLFLTDVEAEAVAAKEVGYQVKVAVRPGNKPLSEGHAFAGSTIANFNALF